MKYLSLVSLVIAVSHLGACKPRVSKSQEKGVSVDDESDEIDKGGNSAPVGNAAAYIAECKNAQVPIPPAWGDPRWVFKGDLKQRFATLEGFATLGGENLEASLYVYTQGTSGVCAGMPRGKPAQVFGVICTSLTTGATCFWDSLDPQTGRRLPISGYDVSKGSGANLVSQNCTDCHRGSTPWIRQAGEPTATAKLPSPQKWYPLALKRERWGNPIGQPVGGCSAGACHAMPKANSLYCAIARGYVKKKLMPPPNIQGAPRDAMIDAFERHCGFR